jgi:hypothetical protein
MRLGEHLTVRGDVTDHLATRALWLIGLWPRWVIVRQQVFFQFTSLDTAVIVAVIE